VQPFVCPGVRCATTTSQSRTSSPSCRDAIDLCWWIEHVFRVAVLKIARAALFDGLNVGIHHHVFRPTQLLDAGTSGAMVVVRVAYEQDFNISEAEA
jgi:hypothetical protein